MLNYFVKFENNIYKVVDGNTNRTVATFINEVDAHIFLRNMITSALGGAIVPNPQSGRQMYPPYNNQAMQQPMQNFNQNQNSVINNNFDDSSIQLDGSNFMQDKLGTLIKLPPEVYAGSFDDSSLGETSGYQIKDIEEIEFLENNGKNIGKKY
jgi:hypothetical protein